jgi:hypothetical protein
MKRLIGVGCKARYAGIVTGAVAPDGVYPYPSGRLADRAENAIRGLAVRALLWFEARSLVLCQLQLAG